MLKVGVLNFQYTKSNYGAVLQAAALEESIRKLGADVEHIDLVPKNKLNIKGKIGRTVVQILKKSYGFNNPEVFENFRSKYIHRGQKYYTPSDLNKAQFDYDACVVGSDQVWRSSYTSEFLPTFFFDFLPNHIKRISYAASFGLDYWEPDLESELTLKIKGLLHQFHAVSVRENTGVDVCNEVFGIKAKHVLDPTLLIDSNFFKEMIQLDVNESYNDIVYYKLDIDHKFMNFMDVVSNKFNFSTENIHFKKEDNSDLYSFNEVHEWLAKIANSKMVITDSFHCVCFSIIFEKQFIYYPNGSRGMTRVESLLTSLGLKNRIITPDHAWTNIIAETIDYTKPREKLQLLKEDSQNFLKSALGV